jgi:hypothetical protein
MNIPLLIDAIVRQTTVLIAQLSTTAGLRAPLAQVANKVFLDLVTELRRQGVGRKVIADMFGLALRSYEQKVHRLTESATERGTTLWEVVLRHIQSASIVSRADVLERFSQDDATSVLGILSDLVSSGLIYKTGRGDSTVYRAAPRDELGEVFGKRDEAALTALVWITVFREGPIDLQGLLKLIRVDEDVLERALASLVDERRLSNEGLQFRAQSCFIPLGEPAGWEAALLDHYQAMVSAICAKLTTLGSPSTAGAGVGGSTFSFEVWQGHPHAVRVHQLLNSTRQQLAALWDEVESYNREQSLPSRYDRVTFYFGQSARAEGGDAENREEE